MPLLSDEAIVDRLQQRENYRLINVSSKLNRDETERLDQLAKSRGLQRGELIRQLILNEINRDPDQESVTPELTEIVAIRLLITNLLKPLVLGKTLTPETVENILTEVANRKRSVALKTQKES